MDHIRTVEKRMVNIVEIGCGTGAGANELTWLHPNLNYTAIDMQAKGVATCKELHASTESRFVATPGDLAGECHQGLFTQARDR